MIYTRTNDGNLSSALTGILVGLGYHYRYHFDVRYCKYDPSWDRPDGTIPIEDR